MTFEVAHVQVGGLYHAYSHISLIATRQEDEK